MDGWAEAATWIVLIVSLLIYSLYKLRISRDPMEELLRAKQLLDEAVISQEDYEEIKSRLLKRIKSE